MTAKTPADQLQSVVMQLSAITITLRHACRLVPGLEQAIRRSAEAAYDELGATTLSDTAIDAVVQQLQIICGAHFPGTTTPSSHPPSGA